jgi:hypothetical protein
METRERPPPMLEISMVAPWGVLELEIWERP